MKTKVAGIIFDLDGTLINSSQDLVDASNVVRQEFGSTKMDFNTVVSFIGNGLPYLVQKLLPGKEKEDIEKGINIFKTYYKEHCTVHTQLYPQVLQTLDYFQDKRKAIVTNKPYEFTCQILQELNIAHYFEYVLGGDSLARKKPDPMPICKVLENWQCDSKETVIVGDGTVDLEAGKSAKILTCAVTYGMRSRQTLEKYQPDFIIENFAELQNLFT